MSLATVFKAHHRVVAGLAERVNELVCETLHGLGLSRNSTVGCVNRKTMVHVRTGDSKFHRTADLHGFRIDLPRPLLPGHVHDLMDAQWRMLRREREVAQGGISTAHKDDQQGSEQPASQYVGAVRGLACRCVVSGLACLVDHVNEAQRNQSHTHQRNGPDDILKNHGSPPNQVTLVPALAVRICR